MTGPLAQQIAVLEECIETYIADICPSEQQMDAYVNAWRAALSSIERHVQDMEKARYQLRVIDADTGEPVDGNELEPAPWGHATTLWFTARDKPRVARVEVVPIERENGDE